MQTTANVTEAKRVRVAPTFSSTEVNKWDLLLRAYLKRDEAEWVLDQVDSEDLHNVLCNRGRGGKAKMGPCLS